MSNRLINETSPYLLQHAHNPVDWYAWGAEALEKAKIENKLILISIGYSACHWCHVMEHESFEDIEIAKLMNERFVCVKVDREERPDIDQIYMIAVQLMSGHGGWPLNCFALPDQRPIYGGTYFNPKDWKNLLLNLSDFYKEKPDEAQKFANKLEDGLKMQNNPFSSDNKLELKKEELENMFQSVKTQFDFVEGGFSREPKFPLPNNFLFTLRFAHFFQDQSADIITQLTLDKMAFGGIYDQIGGGFARYSVDANWFAPHFEKMLYDNAQLISLYSEAYKKYQNPLYKTIALQSVNFIKEELLDHSGGFYSALNADSEGVEGKYYTWEYLEFHDFSTEEKNLLDNYFNVEKNGNWEKTNILYRKKTDDIILKELELNEIELKKQLENLTKKLLKLRSNKVKPSLDDKILTAWNGLMISSLCHAYKAFNKIEIKELAIKSADFFIEQINSEIKLKRDYKKGSADIPAFSDDYAFLILAFLDVYEICFEEKYVFQADKLMKELIQNFYHLDSGLFYYTSSESEKLIVRISELNDNVIPASNSAIAHGLNRLSILLLNSEYAKMSENIILNRSENIMKHFSGNSNYALLALSNAFSKFEVVITGPQSLQLVAEINKFYLPNLTLFAAEKESKIPLFSNRIKEETLIYVCENNTCQLPVKTIQEAMKIILPN